MATVLDRYEAASAEKPAILCDYTPPRSGDPAALEVVRDLPVDFISVAYNPGKLVRADSVTVAYLMREQLGLDALFSISPRDMNKIALQTRLLGAQMLGLENVLVLQGDPLGEREHQHGVSASSDLTSTGLIASIRDLNEGKDYRGAELRGASNFCLGATLDLSRDLAAEAKLALRKVEAGARFFVTQPIYDVEATRSFAEAYRAVAGSDFSTPVFWGLHIPAQDGVGFTAMPERVQRQLDGGRSGVEIARELLGVFQEAGFPGVYVVPPVLRGGARDYEAVRQLLAHR